MVAAAGLPGAASAAAPPDIEGVWSFNGGAIAVQPGPAGTYVGIVVTETKFAECAHPVGQQIWTAIDLQADGSYWGKHQWYFENSGCRLNPTLGLTAWRVISTNDGGRYLRACFSSPSDSQPTIAPDGSASGDSYGCVNSTPVRSGTASFKALVTLPSARKCLSLRRFTIHVHDPRYDAFKTVAITIGDKRFRARRQGNQVVATIDLRGFPRGAFPLTVRGTTVLGRHISGRRVYHTCMPKFVSNRRHGARKKR